MPDVFISYARSTEQAAEQVAEALQTQGFKVWRDDQLPAHRAYGEVIEERLRSADAVLVLWSAEAAKSQWVRAEADAARQAGTLLQASLDGTIPPLPFNQIQCADLSGWEGDFGDPGWQKVDDSLQALTGAAPLPQTVEMSSPKRSGPSICVLPFLNMSGDAEQEYFSDGISEDITTDLSNVSALAVTARNSAFTFKGQSVDVRAVAAKLRVSHVLEGSVRKAGNRVRITAQLIDGATGDHAWAERFDRDLTDIFAIQDEISKAIVAALKLKLLPEEKKAIEQRGTTSAEAYNLYLMARQYWVTGNHGDIRREERVIRICQRAVEIDPNYALAWALMAIAQSSLRYGFGRAGDDGVAAADMALSIDVTIAEAHCPMARRLMQQRRFEEARAEIAAGLALNPNSWEMNREAAWFHMLQRHFQDAARHIEKCVATIESDYYSWSVLLTCYHAIGDPEGQFRAAKMALEQAQILRAQDPSNGAALSVLVRGLAAQGETEQAKECMRQSLLMDADNMDMRYNFGATCAAYLNDPEAALALLGPVLAKARGRSTIDWAEIDPDFDAIRNDPRFQQMLAAAKARLGMESAANHVPAAT